MAVGAPAQLCSAPYELGHRFEKMPIAPRPEHTRTVEAGPLAFLLESRRLTDDIVLDSCDDADREWILAGHQFDDRGPSIHVCDAADGTEHLRFDCFDNEPHYHYLRSDRGYHVICRIDLVAEGDAVEWAIGRLRRRLVPMLAYAGARALAEEVAAREPEVMTGVDEVDRIVHGLAVLP